MSGGLNITIEGDELARKIGGYLPLQSFVLVEGAAGLGKSVVAQRFAYSAVINEQTVTYINTEMTVSSFIPQMASLGFDVSQYILNKKFKYVSLFSSMYDITFGEDVLEKIMHKKELFKSDLIVFDSFNDLLLRVDEDSTKVFALLTFLRKVSTLGKTILFCVDSDNINTEFFQRLQRMSEVYFRLYEKEVYDNVVKILKIQRFQSATNDYPEELPFKVRAGMGIIIDISN